MNNPKSKIQNPMIEPINLLVPLALLGLIIIAAIFFSYIKQ
jgi:hypothetical protein